MLPGMLQLVNDFGFVGVLVSAHADLEPALSAPYQTSKTQPFLASRLSDISPLSKHLHAQIPSPLKFSPLAPYCFGR